MSRYFYQPMLLTAVAVCLFTATARAAIHPTTQPWEATITADYTEVLRLERLGLPNRTFLTPIVAAHGAAWRAADEAGDARAAYLLASCLRSGIGQTVDAVAAAGEMTTAYQRGCIFAGVALGLMYNTGYGVARDYAAAVACFQKAADAGDAEGMCDLGVACERGQGVPADKTQALHWHERAEKTGDPIGKYALADAYARGVGISVDLAKSIDLLKLAAAQGYAPAMVTLGDFAEVATSDTPEDYPAALDWYQKAADAGTTHAMVRLAYLYAADKLGPRDLPMMLSWFKRAADLNDPEALRLLGELTLNGVADSIPADLNKAIEFYRRSAVEGDFISLRWLGSTYSNGRRVKQECAKARRCYRIAAEAGDPEAMSMLAQTYGVAFAARGFDPDPHTEVFWLNRAVAIGNAAAMYDLGTCFSKGDGEPLDPVQADTWYRKSALAGDDRAMNDLGLQYAKGRGVPADLVEAARWFDMAARHGNAMAMRNLALANVRGRGVPVDGHQADRWFNESRARFRDKGDHVESARTACDLVELYLSEKLGVYNASLAVTYANAAALEGNTHGYTLLGRAAATGAGLPKDPVVAYGYFQKGAFGKDIQGMLWLGTRLEHGLGCTMDESAAATWYRRAADAGSVEAMDRYAMLYLTGQSTPRDYPLALTWLRKAVDRNYPNALGHLAMMTARGDGVSQDLGGALTMARQAQAGGRPEALKAIAGIYLHGWNGVPKDTVKGTALLYEAGRAGPASSPSTTKQVTDPPADGPAPSSPTLPVEPVN